MLPCTSIDLCCQPRAARALWSWRSSLMTDWELASKCVPGHEGNTPEGILKTAPERQTEGWERRAGSCSESGLEGNMLFLAFGTMFCRQWANIDGILLPASQQTASAKEGDRAAHGGLTSPVRTGSWFGLPNSWSDCFTLRKFPELLRIPSQQIMAITMVPIRSGARGEEEAAGKEGKGKGTTCILCAAENWSWALRC